MATPPPLLQIGDTRNARVPSVEAARYITSKDRKERARTRRDTVRIYSCFIFWIFFYYPCLVPFRFGPEPSWNATINVTTGLLGAQSVDTPCMVAWVDVVATDGWFCEWSDSWRDFFSLWKMLICIFYLNGGTNRRCCVSFVFFCEFRICFRLYDMVRKEQFAIKAFY